ncbi:MAG: CNNM domain-containing protein [Eubacterium ramulus]
MTPQRCLVQSLIGNNVVNLTASPLATTLTIHIFGKAPVPELPPGILTVLILIFGEISPKTIATLRAEKFPCVFVTSSGS